MKTVYSVYRAGEPFTEDDYGIRKTKQNVLAFRGKIRVVSGGCDFFGSGRAFRSEVMTDPTWRKILGAAERQVRTTGDYHHIFLEDAFVVGHEGDVLLVRLMMGS
jgi:hypothetical protein